jgi:hypothetical protein
VIAKNHAPRSDRLKSDIASEWWQAVESMDCRQCPTCGCAVPQGSLKCEQGHRMASSEKLSPSPGQIQLAMELHQELRRNERIGKRPPNHVSDYEPRTYSTDDVMPGVDLPPLHPTDIGFTYGGD